MKRNYCGALFAKDQLDKLPRNHNHIDTVTLELMKIGVNEDIIGEMAKAFVGGDIVEMCKWIEIFTDIKYISRVKACMQPQLYELKGSDCDKQFNKR